MIDAGIFFGGGGVGTGLEGLELTIETKLVYSFSSQYKGKRVNFHVFGPFKIQRVRFPPLHTAVLLSFRVSSLPRL